MSDFNSKTDFFTKQPFKLPEILDVLIVGGGPGGTAAAFRAKELGLAALVIDFDDILKRIRDYAKEKLILPDFGGGDKLDFPEGGPLIAKLHFGAMDKDDMVVQWKKLYHDFDIPARVGIELSGLEQAPDGVWTAKVWNHNKNVEEECQARNVILTIGRGVPRRFDIPGNIEGIPARLTDAEQYIGAPTCIIGGGTSAAEAVISISQIKAERKDTTPVHWSYRGQKMPKVSKALADVFFEAYIGNGNIRYHPNSEPAAIVIAEDKEEYLSLRTNRQLNDDGLNVSTHLEFLKDKCLACIGEDIPERLLNSLGIPMLTGGPRNKKRMVVKKTLETVQPNVYMIGDILSPAYLETDNFSHDPSQYKEVKHRGNIKVAMCDAVDVINDIQTKLGGNTSAIVVDIEEPQIEKPVVRNQVEPANNFILAQRAVQETPVEASRLGVVTRLLSDDVEENEYEIGQNKVFTIGRLGCDISLRDDMLLSDTHASVFGHEGNFFLRDENSRTGTFLRLAGGISAELSEGDVIRIGKQYLQLASAEAKNLVIHYDLNGVEKNRYELSEKYLVLGRSGDISLEENDMAMSRKHIACCLRNGKFVIKDLNSANGSFLRVASKHQLMHGQEFRVGQQIFAFSIIESAISSAKSNHASAQPALNQQYTNQQNHMPTNQKNLQASQPVPTKMATERPRSSIQTPSAPQPSAQPAPVAVAAPSKANGAVEGNKIKLKNSGKLFDLEKGQTIADILEDNGVKVKCDCHAGTCGSDPVRVVSGQNNLNEMSALEQETIEDICELSPGEYRLACMLKATGPVEIELI